MSEQIDVKKYEQEFTKAGYVFEYGKDEPGKIYTPHRHGWIKLVTLAGSISITTDGTHAFQQKTGDICQIRSGQLHEAVVGPDGWNWLAAWKPEEEGTFDVHE